ncbi:hypothetical protein F5Y16DRAFT_401005 [Xylariaceae sp. FL0255]|nr:hypothetical protein F5Y16DRAFT_401005 [Xylariaceae sp. FL0255]
MLYEVPAQRDILGKTYIIGIVVPALHGTRLLLDDLEKLSDAPETVDSLRNKIRPFETTIRSLSTITEHQWAVLGANVIEQSKTTLATFSISGQAAEIARSITSADLELATVNTQLAELDLGGNRSDTGTEYGVLEQERDVLKPCLELLEALKSRNEEEKERITQGERTTITFSGSILACSKGLIWLPLWVFRSAAAAIEAGSHTSLL